MKKIFISSLVLISCGLHAETLDMGHEFEARASSTYPYDSSDPRPYSQQGVPSTLIFRGGNGSASRVECYPGYAGQSCDYLGKNDQNNPKHGIATIRNFPYGAPTPSEIDKKTMYLTFNMTTSNVFGSGSGNNKNPIIDHLPIFLRGSATGINPPSSWKWYGAGLALYPATYKQDTNPPYQNQSDNVAEPRFGLWFPMRCDRTQPLTDRRVCYTGVRNESKGPVQDTVLPSFDYIRNNDKRDLSSLRDNTKYSVTIHVNNNTIASTLVDPNGVEIGGNSSAESLPYPGLTFALVCLDANAPNGPCTSGGAFEVRFENIKYGYFDGY